MWVSLNTAPAAPRLLRPPISAAEDPKQPQHCSSGCNGLEPRASVHTSLIAHFSKNDNINLNKNITSASGTRNFSKLMCVSKFNNTSTTFTMIKDNPLLLIYWEKNPKMKPKK